MSFFRGQEEVLAELLGDRAPALDVAVRLEVAEGGPHDAEGVEAGMAEEAAIFDGQDRVDEVLGQLLVGHPPPLLAGLVEQVRDQLGLEGLFNVTPPALETADLLDPILVEAHEERLLGGFRDGAGGEGHAFRADHERAGRGRTLRLLLVLETVQDLHEALGVHGQALAEDERPGIDARGHHPALALEAAVHHHPEPHVGIDEDGGPDHDGQGYDREENQDQAKAFG